ncbi:MAG TPA: 3-deoxy-8-phosphooctulonate synthase [Thermoanaerobaculia bacterium]|jgi:2-dehydro-3-deoxyphosphooctonate aldolase (KDO 8-P synthase)|nr:3-deoxy-8-phosphooctulonate synthase [Thermoanaerobaculia bacterium]
MATTTRSIEITPDIRFGADHPPLFIAGPCVIEGLEHALKMARLLVRLRDELKIQLVYKSSFDKANRSSIESFRGPGVEKGMEVLKAVKEETGLALLTDIHEPWQADPVAEVVDILQIPAFLCRQTDLIAAAARTGRAVGVKKGQFLSPEETKNILEKGAEVGNEKVFITERGTSFGYQNLVVDMRSFPIVRALGAPVVYDITHSMQRPGGEGKQTGGTPQFARPLARAAAAAGADGFFMEVHDNPPAALSDRTTQILPDHARAIMEDVLRLREALEPI